LVLLTGDHIARRRFLKGEDEFTPLLLRDLKARPGIAEPRFARAETVARPVGLSRETSVPSKISTVESIMDRA
jgi:hypothetical protein